MLGLGTSVTSTDSGQVYKELSELSNYADLDIHFDFSTLTGDHGDAVTDVVNIGQAGTPKSINSAEGAPTLDRTSLSRACVDFPNSGDNDHILDMAASYTTTGKAMTFFMVMQLDADVTQMLVANARDGDSNYIQFFANGRMKIRLAGGTAQSVTTSNTADSTVSYAPQTDTPMVMLIRRHADGVSHFYADNNIYTALLADAGAANFTLGAIGGTTSGSLVDFNGKICEVGLYDTDIGDDNIPILLESLCTKWGINRRE